MIFGSFPVSEALGVRLAHSLRLPALALKKGRQLAASDIVALAAAGVSEVTGARLDAGEFDEDAAAQAAASALVGGSVVCRPPYTGRCNLYAAENGLLVVDAARIDRLNAISETITLATLPQHAFVGKNQRLATVKVIPFAVGAAVVDAWKAALGAVSPLQLLPVKPRRAALIMGVSASTGERLLERTASVTQERLESIGSTLALTLRVAHATPAMHAALSQALAAGCDLVLMLGATVSKDRADVVPAAISLAGGVIEHFGMPVEPGNMLLCARVGDVPVFNLPGCARSLRHNGIDIVLRRLCAGLGVSGDDIMRLGVGGLLHSRDEDEDIINTSDDRPAPPPAEEKTAPPRVAALILAAGRSTRMGDANKLLCEIDGSPLVLRAANAALASRAVQTLLVTGHESERIEAALAGRPVSFTHNPDYASGMASSLRRGLRALPPDVDAVIILLADMPRISAADVDQVIAAFDAAKPQILVPEFAGRRGNPILWPRRFFAEMAALSGDTGARGLLEQYAKEVRSVAALSPAIFADVDTPAALEEMRQQ